MRSRQDRQTDAIDARLGALDDVFAASGGCRRRRRRCRRRVARVAICSAPLEWPSRPGLPTSSFSRWPSLIDTRCDFAAQRVEIAGLLAGAAGRRRSARDIRRIRRAAPRPIRRSSTPALAASIEAGMMFAPLLAAARKAASAALDARRVALARARPSRRAICSASASGEGTWIAPSPAVSGEGSLVGEAVDADHHLLAALDRLDPPRVGFDQLPLQFARSRSPRPRRPSRRSRRVRRSPRPSAPRPAARSSTLPSKMSPYSSRSVSNAMICCSRSDHC